MSSQSLDLWQKIIPKLENPSIYSSSNVFKLFFYPKINCIIYFQLLSFPQNKHHVYKFPITIANVTLNMLYHFLFQTQYFLATIWNFLTPLTPNRSTMPQFSLSVLSLCHYTGGRRCTYEQRMQMKRPLSVPKHRYWGCHIYSSSFLKPCMWLKSKLCEGEHIKAYYLWISGQQTHAIPPKISCKLQDRMSLTWQSSTPVCRS